MASTKSLGEYRVGVDFNPGKNPVVDEIKRKTAELIDLCRSASMDKLGDPEISRLWALALTHYEDAAMWAVKATTQPISD